MALGRYCFTPHRKLPGSLVELMSIPVMFLLAATVLFAFSAPSRASVWLKTGSETSRPYGHVNYCSRHASDCRSRTASSKLPAASLNVLKRVNVSVNRAIKPAADRDAFGRKEYWTARTRSGDCEDYALAKRAKLMRQGFKSSQLLLTMGHNGLEAHTVLIVRTRDGDFVLDNLTDDVKTVKSAGMSFRKIQSPDHGGRWLRVTGRTSRQP
ncbi:MAG: transglutaminase-like cysteine peptidase [Roseitalea porphyridii]|uniref:transglutaminase-like cysteine peptidase n=1 Tax=Roseitalea porphyridii TaxID=1852022 RepID=UPI0032EB867D